MTERASGKLRRAGDRSMAPMHREIDQPPAASRGQGWLVVAMLCLFIGVSFIDRNIIALMVDPIRTDMGVSDKQIGLLFGLGFALFYVAAGVPLGHLADRGNRKRLLLGGVVLWSLTTLAAAFAPSFGLLAVARAGVAIGEAVLTPVAISMIADLFPRGRQTFPTSIYLIISAMAGAASAIGGGAAYAAARSLAGAVGMAPWRLTFVIVALPGLILAAIFALAVREPARMPGDAADEATGDTMAAAVRYFFAHFALYGAIFVGVGLVLMEAMALYAWAPTLMVRSHGLSGPQSGVAFGVAAFFGVAGGSLMVPVALHALRRFPEAERIVIATALFPAVTMPVLALTIQSANLTVMLVGMGVGLAGVVSGPIFAPLLVQASAPARLRARMTAFYLVFNILLSTGLGPLVVPLIAQRPGIGIAGGLAIMAWGLLLLGLACYLVPLRVIRSRVRADRAALPA